jgi:hypothetical protein
MNTKTKPGTKEEIKDYEAPSSIVLAKSSNN